MSAGGQDNSAASFIGALISLTSHSNIRYQGILSNIDATNATLSLEKVRSWGTEGRCKAAGNPQDEVPPNDHVYDFIVFRAADVVDLRIDDLSPATQDTLGSEQVRVVIMYASGRNHTDVNWIYDPDFRERFFSCG